VNLIVRDAGCEVPGSVVLQIEIRMLKKAPHEEIGGNIKTLMDYISDDEVRKAKELIVKAIIGT